MKMSNRSLGSVLSAVQKQALAVSSAQVGDVFRMHLGDDENVVGKNSGDDGRNKFFIVLGHDKAGNALGVILINSVINPALPPKRQDMHYPLKASKYSFLNGTNRFADCSDMKEISANRFTQLFSADKLKGHIDEEDLNLIKETVIGYEDYAPKFLKRFGLIP